mgnify:FL=1
MQWCPCGTLQLSLVWCPIRTSGHQDAESCYSYLVGVSAATVMAPPGWNHTNDVDEFLLKHLDHHQFPSFISILLGLVSHDVPCSLVQVFLWHPFFAYCTFGIPFRACLVTLSGCFPKVWPFHFHLHSQFPDLYLKAFLIFIWYLICPRYLSRFFSNINFVDECLQLVARRLCVSLCL